ncbi:probable serine/threonine-protein kinase DDB_G0282963 [Oppia nitens]|uniref:probable serine/threonine-protein kinase DDB_G0282963 n=1 Tax=Oppia nitens TaxID=1686743 RepID=UPI0023DAD2BD|nr:probable serine/threonine-protein kinase DDB_G0282963 [Oppia nitens]
MDTTGPLLSSPAPGSAPGPIPIVSLSAALPPPPPVPPPPPGCHGSVQLPHWRSEPLPAHLATSSKEQIERDQYEHLPDKLLNTMNKDKKPFTYTPSGVSGTEKGKLDLSSIRSPKMKKRLLANLADDEEEGEAEEEDGSDAMSDNNTNNNYSERVSRSVTPDVLKSKQQRQQLKATQQYDTNNNYHHHHQQQQRSLTPDIPSSIRGQTNGHQSMTNGGHPAADFPEMQRQLNKDFDAYIQKQMKEIETSMMKTKEGNTNNNVMDVNGLEPEVQELLDSYGSGSSRRQNQIPIPTTEATEPRQLDINSSNNNYNIYRGITTSNGFGVGADNNTTSAGHNPRPVTVEHYNTSNTTTNNNSYNKLNNNNNNNYYENDRQRGDNGNNELLKHVLDGGLQEEIEKFEQISLETQKSFSSTNPSVYSPLLRPTTNQPSAAVWSPYASSASSHHRSSADADDDDNTDGYTTITSTSTATTMRTTNRSQNPSHGQRQQQQPYGSLDRNGGFRSPQPYHTSSSQDNYWSTGDNNNSPGAAAVGGGGGRPQRTGGYRSASVEPTYRRPGGGVGGVDIPFNRNRTIYDVPNYNARPKPFYLCSPPPTPIASPPPPPPPKQFMSSSSGSPSPQNDNQQQQQQLFTTFGKNVWQQKINYNNNDDYYNQANDTQTAPKTQYMDGMYSQITPPSQTAGAGDELSAAAAPVHQKPVDRSITFADRIVTSPERSSAIKSPEPPKPILKKKLPPSQRPPEPTPSKFMGSGIPSRSFRVLQLMTGEDIDNEYIKDNDDTYEIKYRLKTGSTGGTGSSSGSSGNSGGTGATGYDSCKQSNTTKTSSGYSNYEDFGTDF